MKKLLFCLFIFTNFFIYAANENDIAFKFIIDEGDIHSRTKIARLFQTREPVYSEAMNRVHFLDCSFDFLAKKGEEWDIDIHTIIYYEVTEAGEKRWTHVSYPRKFYEGYKTPFRVTSLKDCDVIKEVIVAGTMRARRDIEE